MKKIVMIIVILSAVVLAGTAQNYTAAHLNDPAIQSHQILQTGAAYQGTVYEPFSTTAPSEYHPVAGDQESGGRPHGHIRRGFDTGAETGRDEEYPIGEPWIMAIMAVAFGFVIARRRKRAE